MERERPHGWLAREGDALQCGERRRTGQWVTAGGSALQLSGYSNQPTPPINSSGAAGAEKAQQAE